MPFSVVSTIRRRTRSSAFSVTRSTARTRSHVPASAIPPTWRMSSGLRLGKIVAGRRADQLLQFEAVAVRRLAVATHRDRRALGNFRQRPDGLASVGLAHLGAVALGKGLPDLRVMHVAT